MFLNLFKFYACTSITASFCSSADSEDKVLTYVKITATA